MANPSESGKLMKNVAEAFWTLKLPMRESLRDEYVIDKLTEWWKGAV